MTALPRLLQLALAALIATAGGGLVLGLLAGLGSVAGRALSRGAGGLDADLLSLIPVTILAAAMAVGPTVGSGWLPAVAAGAALWAAGRRWPPARRRLAWAATGAAVSLLVYWSWTPSGLHGRTLLHSIGLPGGAATCLFLIAGATAGLLFRSAMTAAAPFLGLDEPGPDGAA